MSDMNDKTRRESAHASELVECDICRRRFNRRYLSSHKRLAHKARAAALTPAQEAKAVDTILALFKQVSAETKQVVLDRLKAAK